MGLNCFLTQILENQPKKWYNSRQKQVQIHPTIIINKFQVERVSYQKHFGIILDDKLNFKQHTDSAMSKSDKGIYILFCIYILF